jgi:hypothetical protein
MDPASWIALGGLAFMVASALYAAVARGFARLGGKIDAAEIANQTRHNANEQRLTAIETELRLMH